MLTRWLDMDPLRDTTTLRDAMNQLFEHSVVRPNTLPASGFLVPKNVCELDNTYVVQAYVPGVKPEDVEVMARQNTLSIKGRLPEPISDDRKQRMQPHLRQLVVALSPEESAIVRRIHRAKSFIFLREQRPLLFAPDFQAELAATLYDDLPIWHPPR